MIKMRLLACSDIHNNVVAVRQLRRSEGNEFDAVVVAGDIGSDRAQDVFSILQTFECPILYVLGNWDHELEYEQSFGGNDHHLHLSPVEIGGFRFVGFSGVQQHWGKNPLRAALLADVERAHAPLLARMDKASDSALGRLRQSEGYREYLTDRAAASKATLGANRAALADVVRDGPADRTIVVTHDRLHRTTEDLPDVPLFLFGHRHGFQDTEFKGSRFINVSALDVPVSVVPVGSGHWGFPDVRNVNEGGYVVIMAEPGQPFIVEPKCFVPDYSDWERLEGDIFPGAPYVEAEPPE